MSPQQVSAASETESEAASDNNTDEIPQVDGAVMTARSDKPDNEVSDKKEESPVICKMLENRFAETKQILAGETPPATVFPPELMWYLRARTQNILKPQISFQRTETFNLN